MNQSPRGWINGWCQHQQSSFALQVSGEGMVQPCLFKTSMHTIVKSLRSLNKSRALLQICVS